MASIMAVASRAFGDFRSNHWERRGGGFINKDTDRATKT